MLNDAVWSAINGSEYLFLHRLFEPRENSLAVILEQASVNTGRPAPSRIFGGVDFSKDAHPVEPLPSSRVFRLDWVNYISYCVTEEMHGSCGEYSAEQYEGRLLRLYSASSFLTFVARNTGAHSRPYQHFQIACLNHIIDVVSSKEPDLISMSRAEAGITDNEALGKVQ